MCCTGGDSAAAADGWGGLPEDRGRWPHLPLPQVALLHPLRIPPLQVSHQFWFFSFHFCLLGMRWEWLMGSDFKIIINWVTTILLGVKKLKFTSSFSVALMKWENPVDWMGWCRIWTWYCRLAAWYATVKLQHTFSKGSKWQLADRDKKMFGKIGMYFHLSFLRGGYFLSALTGL